MSYGPAILGKPITICLDLRRSAGQARSQTRPLPVKQPPNKCLRSLQCLVRIANAVVTVDRLMDHENHEAGRRAI